MLPLFPFEVRLVRRCFGIPARKLVGVNFECKNQNKMKTIYDWYKQASKGQHKMTPAVCMKMNTRQPLVVIDLDDFIDLIK